jgi:hypothetical protein
MTMFNRLDAQLREEHLHPRKAPGIHGELERTKVNDMTMDAMAMFSMFSMYEAMTTEAATERRAVVPEPEFKPFRFSKRDTAAVRAEALAPANTAREPRTLAELGVPGPVARELEASLRAMGLTRGDRVTGFTFRAADGTRYELRTESVPAEKAGDLAA